MKPRITVRFEEWEYTCRDGCCYEWGTTVYINGEQVTQFNAGAPEANIIEILEHLGYEVEIL